MDTFGLGIGHCISDDRPRSQCIADWWWGWGSTYGSRIAILPKEPLMKSGGGLICTTIANIATNNSPWDTEKGRKVRLGGRQHPYAHRQAVLLRELYPVAGSQQ